MQIKNRAHLFITISLICGALFPLALKVADNNGINIFTFMFLAYLIAVPASLALVFMRKKTAELKGYLRNPREFVFIGLLGFINLAFVDYGLIYAEKFVSASLATVIYRTQPLLMLIFIPIMLRERVSKIQIAALMLAFLGIYIALSGGGTSLFSGSNAGVILFLVFMTFIAGGATVFLKRYNTDMESTMFMFNSVALVIAFGLFLYGGAQIPAFNPVSIVALLYMGTVTLIAVPFFYYSAFRTLKTTFVTNLYFLSPFITILFSGLLLQEPIYAYYIVIAVLVTIGIFIQRFDKKGGTYSAKNKTARFQIFDVTSAFLNTKVDAIYNTMKGKGRVLAVRMKNSEYEAIKAALHSETAKLGEKLFVYTNSAREFVSEEENIFMADILGVREGEVILMCAGDPDIGEEFLGRLAVQTTNV
jgi:drug/metabolite transporter (DMT)-like permease